MLRLMTDHKQREFEINFTTYTRESEGKYGGHKQAPAIMGQVEEMVEALY